MFLLGARGKGWLHIHFFCQASPSGPPQSVTLACWVLLEKAEPPSPLMFAPHSVCSNWSGSLWIMLNPCLTGLHGFNGYGGWIRCSSSGQSVKMQPVCCCACVQVLLLCQGPGGAMCAHEVIWDAQKRVTELPCILITWLELEVPKRSYTTSACCRGGDSFSLCTSVHCVMVLFLEYSSCLQKLSAVSTFQLWRGLVPLFMKEPYFFLQFPPFCRLFWPPFLERHQVLDPRWELPTHMRRCGRLNVTSWPQHPKAKDDTHSDQDWGTCILGSFSVGKNMIQT